jgi:hypothetical protein
MDKDKDNILGYKGHTMYDSGIIYAPYILPTIICEKCGKLSWDNLCNPCKKAICRKEKLDQIGETDE